jgi:alkanesulfonate monooxygenase SsuD/methylene tetrahydromethanopterin reductase-like flavin-dependent oxidoreductase (luciferase family)
MPHRSLAEFVAFMRQAAIVPRPEGEEWSAMIARISVSGRVAAIDEESFWYFLEVLPPKYQRGSLFAFAEGAEALRIFWQNGDAYFCRQLTGDETQEFCRLARIPTPW